MMVQCMATFMDLCYIFRRNAITSTALKTAEDLLKQFHELRCIFITEGVRESISLPRQHSLPHYLTSIPLFGSPNGLCSSITESKHIKAMKEPWRQSSRFRALVQMLQTIIRLEKLAALRRRFLWEGLLIGSTAAHFTLSRGDTSDFDDEEIPSSSKGALAVNGAADMDRGKSRIEDCLDDAGPEAGPQSLSSITLAATPGILMRPSFRDLAYSDYVCHIYQKDSIRRTSIAWQITSTSQTFHLNSSPSSILCATPIVHSQRTLKLASPLAARSRFFIWPLPVSMLLVTSAVLVGCTASAFGAIPGGLGIPGAILSSLYKTRMSLGCEECSLHKFISSSHLQIMRRMMVKEWCSAHLSVGFYRLRINAIQLPVCGLSNLREREGIGQSR